MEKIKTFNPRDLFNGRDRLIIKGGFEPWTLGGKTKLKAGGKIDVPISIFEIDIPLTGIFDISRVETVKAKDLGPEHTQGNMPSPQQHVRYGHEPVTPDSDVIIVHVDPQSLKITDFPMPKTRQGGWLLRAVHDLGNK